MMVLTSLVEMYPRELLPHLTDLLEPLIALVGESPPKAPSAKKIADKPVYENAVRAQNKRLAAVRALSMIEDAGKNETLIRWVLAAYCYPPLRSQSSASQLHTCHSYIETLETGKLAAEWGQTLGLSTPEPAPE